MPKKPQTRAERLAAALRENLKRRKAAERARRPAAEVAAAEPPDPRPSSDKKRS